MAQGSLLVLSKQYEKFSIRRQNTSMPDAGSSLTQAESENNRTVALSCATEDTVQPLAHVTLDCVHFHVLSYDLYRKVEQEERATPV